MAEETKNQEPERPVSAAHSALHFGLPTILEDLDDFERLIKATRSQLQPLDRVTRHDEDIDDALWSQLSAEKADPVRLRIASVFKSCESALSSYRHAHSRLQGVFRGQLRDDFEQDLARAVRGAGLRLERMRHFLDRYQLPRRPHLIRKNALGVLVASGGEVAEAVRKFRQRTADAAPHLVSALEKGEKHLLRLNATLTRLRNQPTRKMSQPLKDCLQELQSIFKEFEDVRDGVQKTIFGFDQSRPKIVLHSKP